ncbi:MAG TPA: hypothetical protein VK306_07200 [Acidimicrobiales bacterium]|nr:hypothetical protein [Acidimicrobiales bacterium]
MNPLDDHALCRPGTSPRPPSQARPLRRALAGTVATGLLLVAACGENDPNEPTVTTAVGTDGDDADNPGDNTPDDDGGGLGTDDADGVGTDDESGGGEIGDLPDEGGGTGTSVGNAEGRPDDIDDTGDTSEPTVDPGDSGGM